MFLFLLLFLNKRLTRYFWAIAIVKRFINNFVSYSFLIVVTTSASFFISIFFHFDFFIILIKMSIVFSRNSFSILTCSISKILNNFSFSISTKLNRYFIVFAFFLNWIKKFQNYCIFVLTTFAQWYATWLIATIMSRTRRHYLIFLCTRTTRRAFFINTFMKILSS